VHAVYNTLEEKKNSLVKILNLLEITEYDKFFEKTSKSMIKSVKKEIIRDIDFKQSLSKSIFEVYPQYYNV
jgi:hypothetical protein